MKLRNYFFGALACLALASCSSDDDAIDSGQEGGGKTAFMAVQLTMPGGGTTRASWDESTGYTDDDNNYKEGDLAEIRVTNAYLFFFKEDKSSWGEPMNITSLIKSTDNTGSTDTDWDEGAGVSIDKISKTIIMFENKAETSLPSSVVAVLNIPLESGDLPSQLEYSTVSALQQSVIDCSTINSSTSTGFVMSNSTYLTGTTGSETVVFEQSLAGKLISQGGDVSGLTAPSGYTDAETPEGVRAYAAANPVVIPVERVLARVHVDLEKSATAYVSNEDAASSAKLYMLNGSGEVEATDTKIISVVNGWWLDNTNKETYLGKNLDKAYTEIQSTWNWKWNHSEFQRSYWATAKNNEEAVNSTKFAHYDYRHHSLADKYCYENTNQNVSVTSQNYTQLVVSANLFIDVTGTKKPLNLVRHKTVNYEQGAFKVYAMTKLMNQGAETTFYVQDGTGYRQLNASDITFKWNTSSKTISLGGTEKLEDYEAILELADNAKTYFTDEGTTPVTAQDINAKLLSEVGPFQYWNRGQCYYYTPIVQFSKASDALNGVIRNHYYDIKINSVAGLGTPVPTDPEDGDDADTDPDDPTYPTPPSGTDPDPDPEYPDDPEDDPDDDDNTDDDDPADDPDKPIIPEKPEDDKVSAIDAQIKILKYRVVSQSVDLK